MESVDLALLPNVEPLGEPLYLHLSITDPEVARALAEAGEGRDRQELALTALRIGILSLKAARGTVDGAAIRQEGDRLLGTLEERLNKHRELLDEALGGTLRTSIRPVVRSPSACSACSGTTASSPRSSVARSRRPAGQSMKSS
jgi:hypothetical protein